jgi:hypothetical protein
LWIFDVFVGARFRRFLDLVGLGARAAREGILFKQTPYALDV